LPIGLRIDAERKFDLTERLKWESAMSKLTLNVICGVFFACLSTAAVAESPQPSLDNSSPSVEAILADLKSRVEQLEYRVMRPSTFQGRGAVGRAGRGTPN
jgi:hypothetical protein